MQELTQRELRVLEAVIQMYIETAEPAGSQAVARRSGLGVSAATVRNTMGELERKGFLFHPHTSAGRIPTDLAYRAYVDRLMRLAPPSQADRQALASELPGENTELEGILTRAAQVLGVLTQELGMAVAPKLDPVVLERLDLVPVAAERVLLVFNLKSGVVRTIFVQITTTMAQGALQGVARVLNERLAGLSLREIRMTLSDRLRDAAPEGGQELMNIFLAEGDDIFDLTSRSDEIHLGSARMLADQPEFSSNERMRGLLDITEQRDLLRASLRARHDPGVSITIGGENIDPRLTDLTLITASYTRGGLSGVIGVLGPTRMPYDKIIGLVEHTSRLVEGLME